MRVHEAVASAYVATVVTYDRKMFVKYVPGGFVEPVRDDFVVNRNVQLERVPESRRVPSFLVTLTPLSRDIQHNVVKNEYGRKVSGRLYSMGFIV